MHSIFHFISFWDFWFRQNYTVCMRHKSICNANKIYDIWNIILFCHLHISNFGWTISFSVEYIVVPFPHTFLRHRIVAPAFLWAGKFWFRILMASLLSLGKWKWKYLNEMIAHNKIDYKVVASVFLHWNHVAYDSNRYRNVSFHTMFRLRDLFILLARIHAHSNG